jgi:hypothetical protein
MNTSHPETKVGLLDLEINRLAKVDPHFIARCLNADWPVDSMCCYICPFRRSSRFKWVSWPLVHLCLPLPHSLLLYYPHQASLSISKLLITG